MLSSLPLNQLTAYVFCATARDSPPILQPKVNDNGKLIGIKRHSNDSSPATMTECHHLHNYTVHVTWCTYDKKNALTHNFLDCRGIAHQVSQTRDVSRCTQHPMFLNWMATKHTYRWSFQVSNTTMETEWFILSTCIVPKFLSGQFCVHASMQWWNRNLQERFYNLPKNKSSSLH